MSKASVSQAWRQLGTPRTGGLLVIADHASNHVPADECLGVDEDLLEQHIAWDIGVAAVAERLIEAGEVDGAILGGVSRLVVDCNREPEAAGCIPLISDGHHIAGNQLTSAERQRRIARFHTPYHDKIATALAATRPAFILSLHSFTPRLTSEPGGQRPWQIGILYNEDDRLARIAIPALVEAGLCVGDQMPYSGHQLNYTMNRHAEANGIPYLGVEMRQDLVMGPAGIDQMARWLAKALRACRSWLADSAADGQARYDQEG